MLTISTDQQSELFEREDVEAGVWVGAPLSVFARYEMVPFRFLSAKYVMMFQHMGDAIGGAEEIAEHSTYFADSFTPEPESRLMKFMHVDSQGGNAFDPSQWSLPKPRYIFQFSELLRDVVEVHVQNNPELSQYFYTASTAQLERCYTRIFDRLPDGCDLRHFEPIQAKLGNYHGFQRKKTDQLRNCCQEAS